MNVTLDELLASREARAEKQREMIAVHKAPLVSFTMNIAGPIKTSRMILRAFDFGVGLILRELNGVNIKNRYEKRSKCGPVLILSVDCDAKKLKQLFTKIEDTHPLGRLFDIDVLDSAGNHLSRVGERGCMVCGAGGRGCAAGRLHSLLDITFVTNKIMTDFFLEYDAQRISDLAYDSLIREVYTAPKPGLVDPESVGSHPDMCVRDFEVSANALRPYFKECFKTGFISKDDSEAKLFPTLRGLGIDAEREMYRATDGKNTHKGIIFSYGIILGALGRLFSLDGPMPKTDEILSEAGALCRPYLENDIKNFSGKTAGERAFIEGGARGIRGEAMDGFPTLFEIALPTYKDAISSGKNKNDAGVITLLHLIANVYDTCLYNRGGDGGVFYAQRSAENILSSGDVSLDFVREMDKSFTEKNLSPGGCADLLALTYFLSGLDDISL